MNFGPRIPSMFDRHLGIGRGFPGPQAGNAGQGPRHDSPATVQAGGVQPYSPHGGREPGAALGAMTSGRDAQGGNPADVGRGLQKSSG